MADDLDQLIRAAMKTLDEQVPSGYFEALPNQTLARLEGSSMQHGSSGTTENRDNVAAPPVMAPAEGEPVATQAKPIMDQQRDEDSGLHDIRNLAQSTKQRLSSRRSITSPPVADDVLASTSGSFKNIALPQPAKMVSLPSIDELPSKAEVLAAEKAAKEASKDAAKKAAKDAKAEKKADPVKAEAKAEAVAAVAPVEAKPVAAAAQRQAFSLPSQQKSSKGPIFALVGLGVAAAAGGVLYLQMTKSEQKADSAQVAASEASRPAAVAAPAAGSATTVTAQPIEVPPPAPPAAEPAKADEGVAAIAEPPKPADHADKKAKPTKGETKVVVEYKSPDAPANKAEPKKAAPKDQKPSGDEGEPSFDALLKEAGVSDQKKETKPKLDKKSLTGDDFKKGMGAVEAKAKSCYTGTQGTALVKLTVAPSGEISKMSVAGDFAGKPEASCIQGALKAATFPPWDGGPQSFTYAVLLSD
jgi:hypothetical protein